MLRRLLLLLGLGVSVYLVVFGGEYSIFALRRLQNEQQAETLRLQALQDSVAILRARADSLETDSVTLERIARERYGLVRPGERLYRFIGEPPDGR